MSQPEACINCGHPKEHSYLWFCSWCTAAKEGAYAACRALGMNNVRDVRRARDSALAWAGGRPSGYETLFDGEPT